MARKRSQQPEASAETNGVATLPDTPQTGAVTEPLPPDKPPETPLSEAQNGTTAETNRPCKTFSCPVGGGVTIECAIWPKQVTVDQKEVTVYSATVRKSYRKEDGSYGNTNFLRGSEIHVAIHLMRSAETWIMQQRTTED